MEHCPHRNIGSEVIVWKIQAFRLVRLKWQIK